MFDYGKIGIMKKVSKDIYLILGIIAVALLFLLLPPLLRPDEADTVKVIQDGNEIASYSLAQNQTFPIAYEDGGYNLLLISNGKASVTDADCKDGLCVRQHAISRNGESIICLPHKLVILIEAKEESELDAVTY